MKLRLALAALLPVLACLVQWLLWDALKPYVWFLFFPAAFFSAWLGGLAGGLAGTLIGALLTWYVFIPPGFSFALDSPAATFSIIVFIAMGSLFAWFFERLQRAMRRTDEALADAEAANARITDLYRKTLELDELKSQFFANVSHELRTPLTLIMSPLARRLAAADPPDERRREDEMMLRNARLLYRHVADLLDAAKLEAGRMAVAYARIDLAALARAMAAQFDSLAHEKGIDYQVEAPAALPAEADGEKVQRILLNLLSNAFKFAPAQGARIALRLREESGQAVIELQDNGPGVPDELRAAVFERFRQIEGDARRRHGGTGLGLAIVKEFAELHGGTADVTAAPGGGALFAVHLPLKAPTGATIHDGASELDPIVDRQALDELRPPAAAAPSRAEPAPDAPLVLVVEDNADMNAFIAAALRPHYRVASAGDGRQGLEMALALAPDLIVSDVMMPRMSGDEMVAELRVAERRRLPAAADVPILMLTARTDDALRVRLFGQGVQGYLNKPFSTEELQARVGALVAARARTLAELRRVNESLEQRVAARTTELAAANQELDAFAYAVSHDLRAPLRAMSGFSQALLQDHGERLDGEATIFLEEIDLAARKMGELIDGILVLSRSTRGELRRDPVDLSALAEQVLAELAQGEPQRRVAWQVEAGLVACGDATMIEAVLRNLLGNAWKYTAKTAAASIRVFRGELAGLTGFCVADNGAGFDMAHARLLFQPFKRLHRQDEFPGLGIGLATVQRIVRRHGGEIRAAGRPGAGASFCFTLPAAPNEEMP